MWLNKILLNILTFISRILAEQYRFKVLFLLCVVTIIWGTMGYYGDYGLMISFLKSLSLFSFEFKETNCILVQIAQVFGRLVLLYGITIIFLRKSIESFIIKIIQKQPHYLIVGLSGHTSHLVESLTNEEKNKCVILVDDRAAPLAKYFKEKGYHIKLAKFNHDFSLSVTELKYAESIVLDIGVGDLRNIEIGTFIFRAIDKNETEFVGTPKKKLHIKIESRELSNLFQREALIKDSYVIDVIPFSYYSLSAKFLFESHSLFGDFQNVIYRNESFSIVLIGDGIMSTEVFYHICNISHWPNLNNVGIIWVASDVRQLQDKLINLFPYYLTELKHISVDFKQLDYNKDDFYNNDIWHQSDNLTNIIIAYDNEETNLEIGVKLHNSTFLRSKSFRSIINMASSNTENIEDSLKENIGNLEQYFIFGNIRDVINKGTIIDNLYDRVAKYIHYAYGKEFNERFLLSLSDFTKSVNEEWYNIKNISDRESSRYQAYHIDVKLLSLGLKKVKAKSISQSELIDKNKNVFFKKLGAHQSIDEINDFFTNNVNEDYFPSSFESNYNKLLRAEHERWCAFHFLNGWEYHARKDKNLKYHDCLIPYEQFNNRIKKTVLWDAYSVLYIPNFLAAAGYEIIEPIINIGIIGHMDAIIEPKHESEFVDILINYFQRKETINLYVSLAPGADIFAANLALSISEKYPQCNLKIIVPLPFDRDKYIDAYSSIDDDYKDMLNKLLSQADYYVVGTEQQLDNTDEKYFDAGKEIADKSELLIAFWDGIDNNKLGGTSSILKYKSSEDGIASLRDYPEKYDVHLIRCERVNSNF